MAFTPTPLAAAPAEAELWVPHVEEEDSAGGLRILVSRYDGQLRWWAIVENITAEPLCDVYVTCSLHLESGGSDTGVGAVVGSMSDIIPNSGWPPSCVFPGERGILVGYVGGHDAADEIIGLSYGFSMSSNPDAKPGDWLSLNDFSLVADGTGFALRAAGNIGAQAVLGWGIDVVAHDENFTPLQSVGASDIQGADGFAPGSEVELQTPTIWDDFAGLYIFPRALLLD